MTASIRVVVAAALFSLLAARCIPTEIMNKEKEKKNEDDCIQQVTLIMIILYNDCQTRGTKCPTLLSPNPVVYCSEHWM